MSDETANQLRAWAASGLTKNLFSGATPLCDTLAQAAAQIEALQAQLADRDRALAEWAEVSQRNFQRAIEAEERLAEARAGLGHTISTGVPCGCGMTGPCMWSECKHPFAIRAKIGGAE